MLHISNSGGEVQNTYRPHVSGHGSWFLWLIANAQSRHRFLHPGLGKKDLKCILWEEEKTSTGFPTYLHENQTMASTSLPVPRHHFIKNQPISWLAQRRNQFRAYSKHDVAFSTKTSFSWAERVGVYGQPISIFSQLRLLNQRNHYPVLK
jgi:hypothetical protein